MKINAPKLPWHVYIIRCRDGNLYTGITNNLDRRLKDHNRGKGCKYTAYRHPVNLVYSESLPDRSSATKREAQIKGWTRLEKEKLIRDLPPS
jgi:putative endonuclease